jgi:hypothetical protein
LSASAQRTRSAARVAASGAAIALVLALAPPGGGEADAKEPKPKAEYGCRVQAPQRFLERRTFVKHGQVEPAAHLKALKYLVGHYGNAGDPTTTSMNPNGAASHAKGVKFFGHPLQVHEKIAPALACVEKRLKKSCTGKSSYTPLAVGGLRTANTYRGAEVSNHLLGIAVDVDPDRNPCCGCVDPWPTSPLCKDPDKTVYQRTALPKCWIRSFERFGFDWLGHDPIGDTMHFEFLGDPEHIKG